MYPRMNNLISGIFIHEGHKHIVAAKDINLMVISPIPYVPRLLQNNAKRKAYRNFPLQVVMDSIPVYYPRYLAMPNMTVSPYTLFLSLIRFLDVILKHFKPSLIHSHCGTPDGYASMRLGKRLNIPTICSFRGSDINIYPKQSQRVRDLTKKVISETDQIVTVSDALRREAISLAHPKKEIMVIHNGCDLNQFYFDTQKRIELRLSFGIENNHVCLLFVGNLNYEKGILELVNSFNAVASSNSRVHLLVVGDGPGRELFEETKQKVPWGNWIHLSGLVPHDRMAAYLCAGDIFVLPSYGEGFPNVIKEALACERPVIATSVGGIPEVVHHEKTGLLIPPKNESALTGAIQRCLSNPEACKRMGQAGRELLVNQFSWSAFAEKHVALYKKLHSS
jgi:glycosyltransferase involved in cell wall biosynthesis